MVIKCLMLCAAALTGGSAAAAQTVAPATSVDWSAIARQDINAAYDIYAANHPGMQDPANPTFSEELKRARDAGLAIADKAATLGGYADALGAFSAELADGHAQVIATEAASSAATAKRRWPGFIAAWRGRLVIHQAGPDSPAPTGSEIIGCDGLPAASFIRKQIGFRGFRPKEPGHWWYRPTQSFYEVEGLWTGPKSCIFRLPDGGRHEAPLTYRPAPENFAKMLAAATDGERTSIGLSEPRKGIFLIGMPDFNPDEEGVKAYRALFRALGQRRVALRAAKAVVIDLRHNNGGSSSWSQDAARQLWGKEAVDRRMDRYFRGARVWWRASADNTAYVESLEGRLRKEGNKEGADWIRDTAKGMKAALGKSEPYYVEAEDEAPGTSSARIPVTQFKTPVYVIVSGRCASACLDALDVFTRFRNVKLIGAPSSGDSTYMDVRVQDLPSGHGKIIVPNKMWVGRPRASGEVYGPHILVTDLDWSTGAFLDRIERDLGR
jgi:hypothetical protein